MKNIRNYIIFFLLSFSYLETYQGYLRIIDMSFCMDECSQFYIESESGDFLSNVIFPESMESNESDLYINRFVHIAGEEYIWCVECEALQIETIYLSSDCSMPVSCFVDPCEVASECQINTPVECIPNYCGGCYADFYDLNGNLVDCYNQSVEQCDDIGNAFFGMCDMFLGYAVVNDECNGVSGCGWESNGIDYSDAFFNSLHDCEETCLDEPYTCDEIENEYEALHSGEHSECIFDNDCMAVWGHCDAGLGGCHYAVNAEEYPFYQINALVNDWGTYSCSGGVCDCMGLPNTVCNNGNCELAYCYDDNPVGCFSAGCPEGYECVENIDCTPSSCFCDDSSWYGNWFCTEDCGGGSCIELILGDLNDDDYINISDVVLMISIILNNSYNQLADLNNDLSVNVVDVVMLVNIILGD